MYTTIVCFAMWMQKLHLTEKRISAEKSVYVVIAYRQKYSGIEQRNVDILAKDPSSSRIFLSLTTASVVGSSTGKTSASWQRRPAHVGHGAGYPNYGQASNAPVVLRPPPLATVGYPSGFAGLPSKAGEWNIVPLTHVRLYA